MVVSWKVIYVTTFNEKERKKNRKRNNMKKKFEHERNDNGKKVVCVLSVEILRKECVSDNLMSYLKEYEIYE